jgi:DNA end-binding protein Ku
MPRPLWKGYLKLSLVSCETIDIDSFVPQAEIDQIYLDSPYYLAPDDKVAEEAFAVIREAMARKKVVGIARVVLGRRERILMLQPRDKGMLATTLRYPYEVRQDAEYFNGIPDLKLAPQMIDIAQELIARSAGHFEPDTFTDRYEEALVGMLRAKQAGQTFTVVEQAEPSNVVDIMDALKRSLDAVSSDANRRPRAASKKAAEPEAETPKAANEATARKSGEARKPAVAKARRASR